MGILLSEIEKPAHRYLMFEGDVTVGEAIQTLYDHQGAEWWFLVVKLGAEDFVVTRFVALRDRLEEEGANLLNVPLKEVGAPLQQAAVVKDSEELDAAQDLAYESEAHIAIVVEYVPFVGPGEVKGLINVGGQRATGFAEGKTLYEMAGVEGASVGGAVPPPPKADEKPSTRSGNVSVGDISGSTGVAIGDGASVNVYNTVVQGPAEDSLTEQSRRFEAAFPQEVKQADTALLYVAVMLPDAPSPFEGADDGTVTENTGDVAVPVLVDGETGELKETNLEVAVSSTGFKLRDKSSKSLTVYPDGRTTQVRFIMEAEKPGTHQVFVELLYEGRMIAEIMIDSTVFSEEEVKEVEAQGKKLNVALKVAGFGLSLSFGAG
ncbi:MAG: hypothetical protein GYB68_09280 [Chloroflexi bacterium]|nr:hypothetical protein [Chloroflexota bacterium]